MTPKQMLEKYKRVRVFTASTYDYCVRLGDLKQFAYAEKLEVLGSTIFDLWESTT